MTYILRLWILLLVLPAAVGCALKTAPGDIALTVGEMALALDTAEQDAFEGKLYNEARHAMLSKHVLRVLLGARAFERAVRAGGDGLVEQRELVTVLDDVAKATIDVPPLATAVLALQRFLGGT